jgi:hypothetical protein
MNMFTCRQFLKCEMELQAILKAIFSFYNRDYQRNFLEGFLGEHTRNHGIILQKCACINYPVAASDISKELNAALWTSMCRDSLSRYLSFRLVHLSCILL